MLFAASAKAATYWASSVYGDPGTRTQTVMIMMLAVTNPSNALGAPNGDFWSLGQGGISVFAFNHPGTFNDTVMTIEKTNGCASVNSAGNCSNYVENAELYLYSGPAINFASYQNGTFGPNNETSYDFSSLIGTLGLSLVDTIGNGEANTGYSYDLSGLGGSFLYVILKDASTSPDGFDVIGVSVSTVPLPPSILLFGAATWRHGLARSSP